MSSYNICFHGEIKKNYQYFSIETNALSDAMYFSIETNALSDAMYNCYCLHCFHTL